MNGQQWPIGSIGWRPDASTVGLLVFVGFTVFGLVALLQSGHSFTIAFTGHPAGLSPAEAAQLTPFSLRARLADGLVPLSGVVSIATAIAGLTLLAGKRRGPESVVAGAIALALLDVLNVVLTPVVLDAAQVGSTIVVVVGLVCASAIVVWSQQTAGTEPPRLWNRARRWTAHVTRGVRHGGADSEDDTALRAEIDSVFPGTTE